MNKRIIVGKTLLFGVLLVYFLFMLFSGSTTFADALRGYEIMHQYLNGGEWNTLSYPHPDFGLFSYFVAWWSPGQWFIPYLIKSLTGTASFQMIQGILITVCLLASLYGFKKLFQVLGFKKEIIYASLLCIVTNQLFYWHTLMYYGGDLYILALFPYFIIFLIKIKEFGLLNKWVGLLLICFTGVFLKNTFLVLILCGISFQLFRSPSSILFSRIKKAIPLMFSFGIVYLTANYFLLSKGATPASSFDPQGYSGIQNTILNDVSFALGSPAGIFTRITFFIQKSAERFEDWENYLNFFQVLPLLLTLIFLIDYKKFKDRIYYRLLLFFAVPFLCFFALMYLQDRAISYEMRHFSAVSFLFFPGFIKWVSSIRGRKFWYSLIVIACLLDLGMFVNSAQKINHTHAFWNTLKLPNEDVEILKTVSKWDEKTENGLLLIEDYWQLNIGVRKNHKIVFQQRKNATVIMSGMELNQSDKIEFDPHFLNNYDEILLVASKSKDFRLEQLNKRFEYHPVKSTRNYLIYRINIR